MDVALSGRLPGVRMRKTDGEACEDGPTTLPYVTPLYTTLFAVYLEVHNPHIAQLGTSSQGALAGGIHSGFLPQ